MVADAHLDTQWDWDVQTTINQYIKNTLTDNFALFKKYPNYKFNFEGAIKYYDKAIMINPMKPQAFLGRGNAKFSLLDKDGAFQDWSYAGGLGLVEAYDLINKHL